MLEQSVKLSRLIIFYFISNFLTYAPILPKREPKTSAFRSVFVFRAVSSAPLRLLRSQKKMFYKRQQLLFLLETGPELGPEWIQILRHLDGAFDWLSVSSFVY